MKVITLLLGCILMCFENYAQTKSLPPSSPKPKETSVTDSMYSNRGKQELLSSYLNAAKKENKKILLLSPARRNSKDQDVNLIGQLERKKVYKIDRTAQTSKYVKETEKNLEVLYAEASTKQWILFFDDADALFSKTEKPELTASYIKKFAESKNVLTVLWCEEDCMKWFIKSWYVLVQ